jgi:hypothetical protein
MLLCRACGASSRRKWGADWPGAREVGVKCEFVKLCCKSGSRLMTARCSPANAPCMAFNVVSHSRMLVCEGQKRDVIVCCCSMMAVRTAFGAVPSQHRGRDLAWEQQPGSCHPTSYPCEDGEPSVVMLLAEFLLCFRVHVSSPSDMYGVEESTCH